jgi:hypothetical protein
MNPKERFSLLPETHAYLTQQVEWYEEIEALIIHAIMYKGTSEAIDSAMNLKREFLKALKVRFVEEYLSYCRPLNQLPATVLCKMLDEAYKYVERNNKV